MRGLIRYFANQQSAITGIKAEVQDLRQNRGPDTLRTMREQHQRARFEDDDWKRFLLTYTGDVDGYVRVFDTVVAEERILNELYAPLMAELQEADGTLAKLSFSVKLPEY